MSGKITRLDIENVLHLFKIQPENFSFKEIKMGHINKTFLIDAAFEKESKKYIVQRINSYVFKNPEMVMHNIDLVTTYLLKNKSGRVLHFHHTLVGKNYAVSDNYYWRVYTYKEGIAYDTDINDDVMFCCGRAFGEFQKELHDFNVSELGMIIPGFHDTKRRYDHLLARIYEDPLGRVNEVKQEIKYARQVAPLILELNEAFLRGDIPLRATHNDTKTNNVLLDKKTNETVAVIDLDTVMPGLIMHDFGDAIRYGANTAKEDETDLSSVKLSLSRYEAFARGFVGEVKDIITPNEIKYMALGALAMTFEVAIRFLDDYLDGDKYFSIDYEKHNLDRSRCQFALLKDMFNHYQEMQDIINDIAK